MARAPLDEDLLAEHAQNVAALLDLVPDEIDRDLVLRKARAAHACGRARVLCACMSPCSQARVRARAGMRAGGRMCMRASLCLRMVQRVRARARARACARCIARVRCIVCARCIVCVRAGGRTAQQAETEKKKAGPQMAVSSARTGASMASGRAAANAKMTNAPIVTTLIIDDGPAGARVPTPTRRGAPNGQAVDVDRCGPMWTRLNGPAD